ncbi:MAG: stage III sporulation protein AD [Lachnospiraceae bacterium]|nr:stage III sporulation protein AD [Lachnospiraceae bacterium]
MAAIIKISILGIAGVLLAVQFKSTKPEYGIYIGFAMGILIFSYGIRQVETVLGQFSLLKNYLNGMDSYLSVLMKVIGISYVCEFAAGICKDGGFSSVADQIEIMGKLSVMFAGLPILFAIIEQIQSFVS